MSPISGKFLQCLLLAVSVVMAVIIIIQQYNSLYTADFQNIPDIVHSFRHKPKAPIKLSASPCRAKRECPADQFSFYIHSGAANVVPPAVCIQNKLVLGAALNNARGGINVVIVNGKTGEVLKTDSFNMYNGEVKPLIDLLNTIEKDSIVMMASYDEPSTKLNNEARKLIAELGSSVISSLAYRDNWLFVGAKGATSKTRFEKHLKSNAEKNKYNGWPEMIELDGCVPKYLE